jgi:hypothetical protein
VDFIYATQFTTLTAIEIEIEHFFLLLYAFYYYYEAALCAARVGDISRKAKGRDNISLFLSFFLFFFYFCFETWDKVFFCTFKQKKTAKVYRVFVFLMRHGLRMLRWDFGSESVL